MPDLDETLEPYNNRHSRHNSVYVPPASIMNSLFTPAQAQAAPAQAQAQAQAALAQAQAQAALAQAQAQAALAQAQAALAQAPAPAQAPR